MFALLLLLLSGWRYRGKDHAAVSIGIGGLSGFCSGLAQTGGPPIVGYWLGRPLASVIARANIVLFFGASDFFSGVSYAAAGLITMDAIKFAVVVGPVYGIGVWFGASLFGKASEAVFRSICYALIAAAVIFGLPALDGVLRVRLRRVGRAQRCPTRAPPAGWWARFALPTLRLCVHQLIGSPRRRCFAGRASGSGSFNAPIRRNAASAARSPLSQAPSIVPHSVSWVASPAR